MIPRADQAVTRSVPSAKTLAKASAAALLTAAAILVTVVLPAEYGIDLLGAGKALGILVSLIRSGGQVNYAV
jgi:hypothetical protein